MATFVGRFYSEKRLFTMLLIVNTIVVLSYIYQDRTNSKRIAILEKKTSRRSTNALPNRNVNANKRPTTPTYNVSTPDQIEKLNTEYYNLRNNAALSFNCGHCAVVTNSGQLLNSSAGSAIDSTECVFRMNAAPTLGFEKDVGSRTTARIVGHSNIDKIKVIERESMPPKMIVIPWLFLDKIDEDKNYYLNTARNLSRNHTGVEFYLFSQNKINISEQIFKEETGISRKEIKSWLSTGWMTLIFALDVCEQIDVYGLVPENHCRNLKNWTNSTPYHYYDPEFKNECSYYNVSEVRLLGGHKFITEKAVYARWAKKYNITFYHPTWKDELESHGNSSFLDTPYLRRYHEAMENGDMKNALLALEKKKKKIERMTKTKEALKRRKLIRDKQKRKLAAIKSRKRVVKRKTPLAVSNNEQKSQNISKSTVLRNFRNINFGKI